MADIVIVEDEPSVRDFLRLTLANAGHTCREAAGPRRALELIQECWPDLVLVDLTLPERDGWALWQDLRDASQGRELRVVLCGAGISDAAAARALELGALGILRKPVRPQKLVATVAGALRTASHPYGGY
jgi:DNA-binding response OmpR family regulator